MKKGGGEILPPLCEYGEILAEWLLDAGPVQSNGMGVSGVSWAEFYGVSWAELQAWRDLSGYAITEWGMETIHRASRAYAHEVGNSQGKPTPSPWREVRQDPVEVMNQIKRGMDALMSSRGKARR